MKTISFLILILLSLFSYEPTDERLLFSSSRNGNSDIFIMNADGSDQTALTTQETEEWGPTWISKNEISFLRQSGETIVRVGLNLETGEEFELKHPDNCILDDKNILYEPSSQLQLYSCSNDIFIYNPAEDRLVNLTEDIHGTAAYPSWGSEPDHVIFTSNHLGTNNIFQLNLTSDLLTQLTDSDSNDERGDISPDGDLLVFSSDRFEQGNQDILVKRLRTGEIMNITTSSGTDLISRFSENSETVYFGSNKDGNWEIFSYNLITQQTIRLTQDPSFDGDPRVFRE